MPSGHQNLDYRVYVHRLRDGSRIAVSQETRIRDQIARQSALYATLPLLLLVPVLLAVMLMLIRLMLRPLAELSRTVDARQEHDLKPLPKTDLPTELQPFVNAINGLLGLPVRPWKASAASLLTQPTSCALRWPPCRCRLSGCMQPRCPRRPPSVWKHCRRASGAVGICWSSFCCWRGHRTRAGFRGRPRLRPRQLPPLPSWPSCRSCVACWRTCCHWQTRRGSI